MKTSEKIQKLKNAGYSEDKIYLALMIAEISDPDAAYTHLEDMGELQAAEIVEILFFGSDEFFEKLEPESDESEENYFEPDYYFDTDTLIADQFDTDITFNG